MGPVWCTGTVEREKLLESYNGYVALVGARSGSDSGLSVLPLGEWIGEFATGLCGPDGGGFLSSGSDAELRVGVLSETGSVDGGTRPVELEHGVSGSSGSDKLACGSSSRLDDRSGVLKGPNGGLSVGRGSKYEKNQLNRERRKSREAVRRTRAGSETTFVESASDEEREARRSLAEVWQVRNKLKLMNLRQKLAEEEDGLSSQALVRERKKLEEQCRLVAARQKLVEVESRVTDSAPVSDKSAGVFEVSGGEVVRRSKVPSSSTSNRERVLEKQVAELTEELAALRFQVKSNTSSGGSGVSEREITLERRNEELEREVMRLRSDKQLLDAGAQRKVYYKERDKVYKQFLDVTSENEKLKKQLASFRGNSSSVAGPAIDVQALLKENAAMRDELHELRQRPVVKDGITERDISQLKMWGVEQVRVQRRWW